MPRYLEDPPASASGATGNAFRQASVSITASGFPPVARTSRGSCCDRVCKSASGPIHNLTHRPSESARPGTTSGSTPDTGAVNSSGEGLSSIAAGQTRTDLLTCRCRGAIRGADWGLIEATTVTKKLSDLGAPLRNRTVDLLLTICNFLGSLTAGRACSWSAQGGHAGAWKFREHPCG